MSQIVKTAISKNYYAINNEIYDKRNVNGSSLNLNDVQTKIKIYEDRVSGWFLEIAEKLKSDNEAGFVILSMAIAYIEGNQQFREGKMSENNSKKFFIKGLKSFKTCFVTFSRGTFPSYKGDFTILFPQKEIFDIELDKIFAKIDKSFVDKSTFIFSILLKIFEKFINFLNINQ